VTFLRCVAVLLTGALSGCCPNVVAGDPKQPMELQIVFGDQAGKFGPAADGGVILVRGGQGAQMVSLSVRARNLNSCSSLLEGVVVSPGGSTPSTLIAAGAPLQDLGDGWLGILDGDLQSAVSLPIQDPGPGVWTAVARVTDDKGRKAEMSEPFSIGCRADDRYCRCTTLKQTDAGCQ
jgi:hypothetical protein